MCKVQHSIYTYVHIYIYRERIYIKSEEIYAKEVRLITGRAAIERSVQNENY